jgi:hypothetical protein
MEKLLFAETEGGQIAILKSPLLKDDYWYRYPEIFFEILDEKGETLKSKKILGDLNMSKFNAYELDNIGSRYLKYEKDHYVAYFSIQHNFAKSKNDKADVHQGDTEIYISKDGELLTLDFEWGVSHSFAQRISLSENYTLKLAKGDGYPRGLAYSIQDHIIQKDEDFEDENYYPSYAMRGNPMPIGGTSNYVDLVIGDGLIDETNKKIYIAGTTQENRKSADIFLVIQDFENKKPKTIWLTNSPEIEEHSVRLFDFKNGKYLVLWGEYEFKLPAIKSKEYIDFMIKDGEGAGTTEYDLIWKKVKSLMNTKAAFIDKEGKFISTPIVIDIDLCIANKDVAAKNDYLYNVISLFDIYFNEAVIEKDRIILPFYYPLSDEIIFHEIYKN